MKGATGTRTRRARRSHPALVSDPLWYKDAIIYELRVGSFHDSDADGIGDFRGLAERLDYLQDLGVTALWLLPFYPSPLRDDGYDIADYANVNQDCGTLDDFKLFLHEAHRRGLRVITELVINHTSDQHPWFQRARRAPPGSRHRNFYVWSEKPDRFPEARVIFQDFERSNWTWDPMAGAYFWHRFYSHQPDLNFDSPDVRKAILRLLDFWLSMGVDGMRLDAIPYLYERDGTNCENLPETHQFLKNLRAQVDAKHRDRMLLAEANQWPEDAVAYFGKGDECHMAFHFPVMPRLFMSLHMEDRFPIVDILAQTPEIPENCQWALFLRNHDELTLEMVTDEERDYMYRVYTSDTRARINLGIRHRMAPLLGNDRRRIELMNALLFSLPGTPVIYYGDEIGMGDNIYLGDRNGVRTPMQWSSDRNAGFSRANPQRLYLPVIIDPSYHYEAINVETQQNNPRSLLSWMKRLIALRKRHRAFGRGSIEFLSPSNRKVLAFIRRHGEERILVVANLSRFVEYVELDLSAYRGMLAVELFGRKAFPPIGDLPYLLTLGPHSFYWFALQPDQAGHLAGAEPAIGRVRVAGRWDDALRGEARSAFEAVLPPALRQQRWFGAKAVGIKSTRILDALPFPNGLSACLLIVRVELSEGDAHTYAVPVAFAEGERAAELRRHRHQKIYAELEIEGANGIREGILYDAVEDAGFCSALLDAVVRRRTLRGSAGELSSSPTRALRHLVPAKAKLEPSLLRAEQSNSSILYDRRLILKLFRRLTEGTNPDLEIGRFLTERTRFTQIASVAGALEYRVPKREPITLGILQAFVPNEGDAWRYTLDQVEHYFERALAKRIPDESIPIPEAPLLELVERDVPPLVSELLGGYLETARLLGRRVAELHQALASNAEDPNFAPEPFTTLYQRSLYQSLRNLTARAFETLRQSLAGLPLDVRGEAEKLAGREGDVLRVQHSIATRKISASRIRCHGDLHLGQVLHTGTDVVIIDFEGEPARSLGERRLKRSPLRDVAGMLRSFDYAAHHALFGKPEHRAVRSQDVPSLEHWARLWRQWVSSAFLRAYLHHGDRRLVPSDRQELDTLLRALLLEKAIYELSYELNNRPEWVRVPVRAVLDLLGEET